MSQCIVFNQIPGLTGPATFTIEENSLAVNITGIRFTDGILAMPQGQSFSMGAVLQNSILVLTGSFTPAVPIFGDQLLLKTLRLELKVKPSVVGSGLESDSSATNAIVCSGEAEWKGSVPNALGAAGGKIPLAVSFVPAVTGGRFTVSLATPPLDLKKIFTRCNNFTLSAEAVTTPTESFIILAAKGEGTLIKNGTKDIKKDIANITKLIFGPGKMPAIGTVGFNIKQKISLGTGSAVYTPVGMPVFDFTFPWDLPPLPQVLNLQLTPGKPQFNFELPQAGAVMPPLGFTLKDCVLQFPSFEGSTTPQELASFILRGNLNWQKLTGNAWKFNFQPTEPGSLQLPAVIRQFLDFINWGINSLPSLEEIEGQLRLSMSEVDFLQALEGLQPPPGLNAPQLAQWITDQFNPVFRTFLDVALAINNNLSPDRIFAIAFTHLQQLPAIFDAVWAEWFRRGFNTDFLIKMLLGMVRDVSANTEALSLILRRLVEMPGFNFHDLWQKIFDQILLHPVELLEAGIRLFTELLNAMLQFAGKQNVAQVAAQLLSALSAAANNSGTGLKGIGDLPGFASIPELSFPGLKVPPHSLLAALGLQSLLTISSPDEFFSFLGLPKTFSFLDHILGPVNQLLLSWKNAWPRIDATMVGPLFEALVNNAKGDPASEMVLLQMGRAFPPLGLVMGLVSMASNLLRGGITLAGNIVNNPGATAVGMVTSLEENDGIIVRRLPAPAPAIGGKAAVKYIILSDVHRDGSSDARPPFQAGSIEHFRNNQRLYTEILDFAIANGFTVLENGDCEELWFIRDFATYGGPREKLEEILVTHEEVYERLNLLHKQKRYFRNFGNHDSYLRDDQVRPPLTERMQKITSGEPSPDPFIIHDYLIIPGVKTMNEHDGLDLASDIATAFSEIGSGSNIPLQQRIENAGASIANGRLGMDSNDYTSKKPLIVTHGHQWDIANCDAHNLAGKLIANAIGVTADMLNDPLEDLRGIALSGSPFIDFRTFLAGLPVFNNFPQENPSVDFAHKIQHQADKERLLNDDLLYLESLAALGGMFTLAVNVPVGATTRTFTQALATQNPSLISEHLFNMMAIGHTHYPHNQPYFNIQGLLDGSSKDSLVTAVQRQFADATGIQISANLIKSKLLNSGTSGWMEGVVWGIMIEEDGQPRLVYWTNNTRPDKPNHMDWELSPMPASQKSALNSAGRNLAGWMAEAATLAGESAGELLENAGKLAMPMSALIRLLPEIENQAKTTLRITEDQHPGEGLDKLGTWVTGIFLSMLRRQIIPGLRQPSGGTVLQSASFTIEYILPPGLKQQTDAATNFLSSLVGIPDIVDNATKMVCAICAFVAMRLRPISGGSINKLQGEFPIGQTLFGLLPMLTASTAGMPTAAVALTTVNNITKLTITLTID